MSYPTIEEAMEALEDAEKKNPGKWIEHSKNVAKVARMISERIEGVDPEKSYILGLLHDIGRYVGVVGVRHILEGYWLCSKKGWDEVAKICLTHSFMIQDIRSEIAKWDVNEEEGIFIDTFISDCKYDYYDRLIQLCDSLATEQGICMLETRFVDVTRRYGVCEYTVPRWNAVFDIKEEMESKIGCSIYEFLPIKII